MAAATEAMEDASILKLKKIGSHNLKIKRKEAFVYMLL
jgi:hypothetical protein